MAHGVNHINHYPAFWGEKTCTLDWCEENYLYSTYIAEFCQFGEEASVIFTLSCREFHFKLLFHVCGTFGCLRYGEKQDAHPLHSPLFLAIRSRFWIATLSCHFEVEHATVG